MLVLPNHLTSPTSDSQADNLSRANLSRQHACPVYKALLPHTVSNQIQSSPKSTQAFLEARNGFFVEDNGYRFNENTVLPEPDPGLFGSDDGLLEGTGEDKAWL